MDPEWPDHFQPDVVREAFGRKLTSYTITLEAWRRGLHVTYLTAHMGDYRISDDQGRTVSFRRSRPDLTTGDAVRLANNKFRTIELLRESGVSTPNSRLIDLENIDISQLQSMAEEIGYPVVIKPLRGSMGKGVFAGIQNSEQLERRFEDMVPLTLGNYAMIESHVQGDDYRVLVVGGRFAGACRRVPANVVGDGKHRISDLISRKNRERKKNPFLSKGLIKPDHEVEDFLDALGYDYDTIPSNGEYVRLRSAANASAGGDVVDVSEELPEAIRDSAVRAVHAIPGLFCGGVDVLYQKQENIADLEYSVIEINAHPQIGVNMYPTHGPGQDAPKHIIDACFPESQRSDREADKMLSFHLSDLLAPIWSGAASEVTLKTIPDHGFPIRQIIRIPSGPRLTIAQKKKLRRSARAQGVAGSYRQEEGEAVLLLAGTQERITNVLKTAREEVFEFQLAQPSDWTGPVSPGFTVID